MEDFCLIHRYCHQEHAYDLEQQNQNDSLSVQVFNIPSALAAVFLSAPIRHPERERLAASLCAFWLSLELGERIERLGLAV
jgi:hypothetical protein